MTTRRKFIIIGLVGLCLGGSTFGGYLIARHRFPTFQFFRAVERRLIALVRVADDPQLAELPTSQTFDSILLRLSGSSVTVPVERDGAGGGLTSFGDAVLLLTHEGRVFSARSADDLRQTDIRPPDNGYGAYQRVASLEKYREYEHAFFRHRYNDIIYFESSRGPGLAVSYTAFHESEECYDTAVAVSYIEEGIGVVDDISIGAEDWHVIYRTAPCLPLKTVARAMEGHVAGGRVAFAPPHTLYLASGDYAWDGRFVQETLAQDPEAEYGKVIAIDLEAESHEIISSGHRNPQGIVVDTDGNVWVAEHGPRGGDELNRIIPGSNYGWPVETLGTRYNRMPMPEAVSFGRHETFTPPVFSWLPSLGVGGLTQVRGFHESWDGDLLMSGMRAGSLQRIRIRDGRVLFSESIPVGTRVRYIHQQVDGPLVMWTDDRSLVFLTVADDGFATDLIQSLLADAGYDESQRSKVEIAVTSCMECHSFEPSADATAPGLSSIFEAPIGATAYAGYSEAMRGRGGVWTRSDLLSFLDDPASHTPGTSMPDPGVDDPFVLSEIVSLLEGMVRTDGEPTNFVR